MGFRVSNAIIAIVVVGMILSCTPEEKYVASDDGYQYMFIRNGDGDLPQEGDVVTYNMTYKTEKDSVLFESTAERPALIPCNDEQWDSNGPLFKAFKIIREGDSIIIKIPTKTLFAESFKAPMPPDLDPEGEITFYIGASKIMTEEEMRADAMERGKEQMNKDIEIIEAYLKENNVTAQSTESGLRYVIDAEGTGEFPQPGQKVFVHYTGTLLGGAKFDSSFDHNPAAPLDFVIGKGQVIPGWDEGIALLKPGGKGTLYIPSQLAYGPRGAGGLIGPNSVLKFDVELIEIE